MSNVYRSQVGIGDDELEMAKNPVAFVTVLLQKQVRLIEREHAERPDPGVRGGDWRITHWHDLKTRTQVYTVYCGAQFDLDRWTNPGKRINRLSPFSHNEVQTQVAHIQRKPIR